MLLRIRIWVYIGVILGDNGKGNGNYYNGLYRDYRVYGWLSRIRVPFWIPIIIRHLIFRVSKKGFVTRNPNDAHPAYASNQEFLGLH